MITKELVEQAVKTAYEDCDKECALERPCHEAFATINKAIGSHIAVGFQSGGDPANQLFFGGIHIGYRLRQLETETLDKSKVN